MSRKTLGDAKDPLQSSIASAINIDPSDSRFIRIVNEAQERIVKSGELFWGLYEKVQVCVTGGCLVWPREIAAIEAVSVCNSSLTVRNQWFEFLQSSAGLHTDSDCADSGSCASGGSECGTMQLFDRGTTVAFEDILGINKKIRVYSDVAEAADAKILLLGYDENNNWIRTQVGGVWMDGEYVLLSTTPQLSTKFFSSLTGVQKPVTNGAIRLYEYDTTLTTQRAIAIYQPDETRPIYRKSLISGLANIQGGVCENKSVIVMAKLEFIPARVDTDWLMVPNLGALKLACMSIIKEERNVWDEAAIYFNGGRLGNTIVKGALGILRDELRHYNGHGVVAPMRMPPRSIYGGGVTNLV